MGVFVLSLSNVGMYETHYYTGIVSVPGLWGGCWRGLPIAERRFNGTLFTPESEPSRTHLARGNNQITGLVA